MLKKERRGEEERRIEIMQFQTFCAIKAFLLLVPPSLPPLLSPVIISIAPSRDPDANGALGQVGESLDG